MKFRLLILASCFVSYQVCLSQIPSFPEAQGFGSTTPGGRGGKLIKVTNLNDHGPGSLRDAIEAKGPRIIVFTVGGIINLETKLEIETPFITIAGQTAPGDGICIRGGGIAIQTHDVIMRYLRIRPGDIDFGPRNRWSDVDALTIGVESSEVFNIIIDHCSLSWAVDENIGMWNLTHDITIQNCIISEGLHRSKHPKRPHSSGMLIGDKATNISVYRNLFAHNKDRNPLINGNTVLDFRNNIIYNSGSAATDIVPNYEQKINYVGNFILSGKNSYYPSSIIVRGKNYNKVRLYVANNVTPNHPERDGDNWHIVKNIYRDSLLDDSQQLDEPFPHPQVNTLTADEALEIVLDKAGATLPQRDAIDRKVVRDVRKGQGGIINSKNGIFEWPPYNSGLSPVDTDNDGMPDHWEEQYGLNPQDSTDNDNDPDQDGYLNIEEYINRTHPKSTAIAPMSLDSQFAQSPLAPDALSIPYTLSQNAPNPFADSTLITFSIGAPAHTRLYLINQQGAIAKDIIDGFMYEGKYEFYLSGSTLSNGVYTLYLTSGSHEESIKVIHNR